MSVLDHFLALDIRVGTIEQAEVFPEARKPAYKLFINFGDEIGRKQSSAQITDVYAPADLIGKQVSAIVNLPPRQIGSFVSEVLVTGANNAAGEVVLLSVDRPVPNGSKVY